MRTFSKLDLSSSLAANSGIVVLHDERTNRGVAREVLNLERELPGLLGDFPGSSAVYWQLAVDAAYRAEILVRLTRSPEFVG